MYFTSTMFILVKRKLTSIAPAISKKLTQWYLTDWTNENVRCVTNGRLCRTARKSCDDILRDILLWCLNNLFGLVS